MTYSSWLIPLPAAAPAFPTVRKKLLTTGRGFCRYALGVFAACELASAVVADEPVQPAEPASPQTAALDVRAERIVTQMRAAREQLAQLKAGKTTQDIQQSILDDLDELLNTPPHKSPQQNSNPQGGASGGMGGSATAPSQSEPNHNQNQREPSSAAANDPALTPPNAAQRNRQEAEDSTERTGPRRATEIAAARRRRLEVDIWGHLPPHLRDQLLNTYGEKMVPRYEELVKKFYEALSEPPDDQRPRR